MKSLTYIQDGGPLQDRVWKGKRDGQEVLYTRVAAGVAFPKPDQPQGAVVVFGELYAREGPPTFEALGARVGPWGDLERGLRALRRVLKPEIFAVEPENEEAVEVLRRVPGLREASGRVPCAILPAPKNALGEIARQRVDALVSAGRLTLKPVQAVLDQAAEPAAVALQCIVTWLLKHKARYGPKETSNSSVERRVASYAVRRPPEPGKPIPVRRGIGAHLAAPVLVPRADRDYHFGSVRAKPRRLDLVETSKRRARGYATRRFTGAGAKGGGGGGAWKA